MKYPLKHMSLQPSANGWNVSVKRLNKEGEPNKYYGVSASTVGRFQELLNRDEQGIFIHLGRTGWAEIDLFP